MATKILAVNVLLAFGVCVFAVTLAVLLAPIVSSEAVLEWLTTTPSCGGAQRLSRFEATYSPKCLKGEFSEIHQENSGD